MKDSGVPWIGEIPKGWKISRVKHAFTRKNEKAHQDHPVVLSLARTGVRVRDLSNNEGQIAESYYDYNPVAEGDLLLNPMDLYSGANCSISRVVGVISPAYVNLRYKEGIANPSYYDYYFKTQYWAMAMFAHGKGVSFDNRWTLGIDTLFNYFIPAPTLKEQQCIAGFLDVKCAEIDSILEKTRTSIEKYRALKLSVITEAVTKGIRGNRPIKETCVEWIGKIPAEWDVIKIKWLLKERNSRSEEGDEEPLSMSQKFGIIPTKDLDMVPNMASSFVGAKLVYKGDLVFNKLKAHLGVFAVSEYDGLVSPDYAVYYSAGRCDVKYLERIFKTPQYISEFRKRSTGVGAGLTRLYTSDLFDMYTALPSETEQQEIAAYLDEKCAAIDSLIASKEALITELEAYKKSIIYEYVTGKKEVY